MKGDRFLSYAILLQPFFAIMQLILPMFGITSVDGAARFRVYASFLSMAPAIYVALKRNVLSVIMPIVIYLFLALMHYAVFPASHAFLESRKAITLTPIVILTGSFIYNIRSMESFKKVFLWVGRAIVPIAVLFVWGHQSSFFAMDESTYDMSYGYTLLLFTLFLFTQNNAIDKVLSLVMWVLIIFDGSRGPAIVAAVFFVISFLFYTERKKVKIWQVVLFVTLVMVGISKLPQFLDFSTSRTVYLYKEGALISHDSDRSIIYSKAMANILDSPIVGNGIGSDWSIIGGYCHNFFLELTLHYGIIVSLAICLYILITAFCLYMKSYYLKKSEDKQLFVLILIGGIMPLIVSSSYLLSSTFGMVIGCLLRYSYNKKITV